MLEKVNKENLKELRAQHPKYDYPFEVITSAAVGKFSKYGIDFRVEKQDAEFIRDEVRAAFPDFGEISISSLGVVIGAHCGPGLLTCFYLCNERIAG